MVSWERNLPQCFVDQNSSRSRSTWGTFTTTPQVSAKETTIHLSLKLENKSTSTQTVEEKTQVFATAIFGKSKGKVITNFQQKLLPKKEVKAK